MVFEKILTRDFLISEYVIKKKSSIDIAREVGCCKKTVLDYMERYGIPRRSSGYSKHLKMTNHFPLTREAINYIDGLLLGDGHILQKTQYSARYDQQFSARFRLWAEKVRDDLARFGIESRLIEYNAKATIIAKTGQRLPPFRGILLYTRYYPEFVFFRRRWYPNRVKSVPRDIEFTPQVLANWYMGDGDYDRNTKRVTLNVNSFSLDDVNFLIKKLRKMGFKAKNHPKTNQDNQPRIRLTPKSSRRFLEVTKPFKVPCFDYKWGLG